MRPRPTAKRLKKRMPGAARGRFTLAEAREERAKARALAKQGINPSHHRQLDRIKRGQEGATTFGLMVQPEALRGFLERAGTLPRGTGFIARFLIAWPGSTQGTRAYRPAPEAMPQVALFGARIRELLAQPLATDAHGCLTPAVLDLSLQARAEWIRFHDEIERELGARGAFRGVHDVAAKAAENAARLAALFHVLEHGASGTIAPEEIRAAACIVGWHLNEARRLLADLDTPPSLAAAIRLDAWLRNEAQANDTDRVSAKRTYGEGKCAVRTVFETAATCAPRSPSSPSVNGRGWRKTGAGGALRSIRRCWMAGSDRRRFDFDTGGGCYSCYRRPVRTLIGSRSSNGSRGWRVGNRESSGLTSVMACCGHRPRAIL